MSTKFCIYLRRSFATEKIHFCAPVHSTFEILAVLMTARKFKSSRRQDLIDGFTEKSPFGKYTELIKPVVKHRHADPEKWKSSQRKLLQMLTPKSFEYSSVHAGFDQVHIDALIGCDCEEDLNLSMRANDQHSLGSTQDEWESRYQDVSMLCSLFQVPGNSSDNIWSSSDILSSMLKYTDIVGRA